MLRKEYKKDKLTIVWQPEKCVHAGVCVKSLPHVYKPKEKPWINTDNATMEELKDQIDKCPSGALSYIISDEEDSSQSLDINSHINVEVVENGPLIVHGKCEITSIAGKEQKASLKTAFCRCGHSSNKPYCDGKHRKVDFRD